MHLWNALVLRVISEQRPIPGLTGEGQTAFMRDKSQALVLVIPIETHEI